MDKPEIQYPCQWSYKIIGSDRELIANTVSTTLAKFDYHFEESHQSRTGKFVSFNLSLRVESEAERMDVFSILSDIPTVKLIL